MARSGGREVLPALPWAGDDNAAIVERLVSLLEVFKNCRNYLSGTYQSLA